jgi:FtsP/CotA-like multicopper oxidase with cupredoxin domain
MNNNARTLALVAAAAALAITAFLVLRPSDDDTTTSSTTTTSAPAKTTTTGSSTTTTSSNPTTLPDATVIHVVNGKPVGGVQKISVKKGDTIRLKVTSDKAGEIHVHGFDLEEEAGPGKPASFNFKADIEGRFTVESHVGDVQIGEISVNP